MNTSVVAPRTLRITLGLLTCGSLLLGSHASFLVSGPRAQAQNQNSARGGQPRPGKPEAVLPNLENVENESRLEREPAPPIPSIIRSPKVPVQPWNGRRVGDPGTRGEMVQAVNRTARAHARRRAPRPPSLLDDQFIANFFNWALLRAPNGNEPTFWNDHLRVAYAQGQGSLKLAAVELGKTLFESAEYAGRQRNDEQYVYDQRPKYCKSSI